MSTTPSPHEITRAEGPAQLEARLTYVAPDHDLLVAGGLVEDEPRETDPDGVGDPRVQLVWNSAPDVVGLEYPLETRIGRFWLLRRHGDRSLLGTHRAATRAMIVTVLKAM